jgi:hypothetical protein
MQSSISHFFSCQKSFLSTQKEVGQKAAARHDVHYHERYIQFASAFNRPSLNPTHPRMTGEFESEFGSILLDIPAPPKAIVNLSHLQHGTVLKTSGHGSITVRHWL